MSLKIYNSLSGEKEAFVPVVENRASVYVCGPTVYSDAHLGHAKTYISFDVILRYLRFCGLQTFYVQNITDVGHLLGDQDDGEDKILKKSRETRQEPMALVESYTRRYFDVMDQLGVVRPDISPRATGHIPEQLEAIQSMIDQGLAYESNGSVYFNVSADARYGILSRRNLDDLVSGTREEIRSDKRNPHDFALWKYADPSHLMQWTDPWSGKGFPGWHTECVVMSTRYLGNSFDIHGGGMDLKFPHHECELAQARALGKSFAKYWMHTNMLTIDGQKMSKSLGNFITLQDAISGHDPMVIRYFMISGHYRSVVDYSANALSAAENALSRLWQVTRRLREKIPENTKPAQKHFQEFRQKFCQAMDDDFSTPQALAVLFDLSREVNALLNATAPDLDALIDAEHLFSTLGGEILGIIPATLRQDASDQSILDDVMQVVIGLRKQFREEKNYQKADYLRDRLGEIGIQIKDHKDQSTTWEHSKDSKPT
ncbi:MAG: cysteine--tRNA ligase [SAR324 cluster bacterium]|nr:cysteine--tRNA ligase [SAR324 cluster bacterium]